VRKEEVGKNLPELHIEPFQPLLHVQVFGPEQLPWTQAGVHVARIDGNQG